MTELPNLAPLSRTPEVEPSPEMIAGQLAKILASPVFSGSERMTRFLRFTVQCALAGKAGEIKEYVIGVEVFDRKDGFDPRSDPVVRVEARRLRAKLSEYYEGDGRDDPVEIGFPKGGYAPVFRMRQTPTSVEPLPDDGTFLSRLCALLACGVLLVAGVVGWFAFQAGRKVPATPPMPSVAVLPFVDFSPQRDQEYFCEGMTEEIIHALTKIEGLRVPARSSVYQLKGASIEKVGETLHVAFVLEGSIRREGDHVKVSAQLVRVSDNTHIWSEVYPRDLKSIFAIQEDISRSIVKKMRVQLAGDKGRIVKRATESVEAYDLYLQGRHYYNRFSVPDRTRAIELFTRVTEIDANYGRAWAGLALAYASTGLSSKTDYTRAKEAADKALLLDDSLAEAHAALASIKRRWEFDWVGGERESRRAIALSPYDSMFHASYSNHFMSQGRFAEAEREARTAIDLDPLSPENVNQLAQVFFFSRRYDEAIREARRALSLDPGYLRAYHLISRASSHKGAYEEAIRAAGIWAPAGREMPGRWLLGYAYARSRRTSEALQVAESLVKLHSRQPTMGYEIAYIFAGLKDRDRTLRWLEIGYEEGGLVGTLKVAPEWDLVRTEPRYLALLKKVGLGA